MIIEKKSKKQMTREILDFFLSKMFKILHDQGLSMIRVIHWYVLDFEKRLQLSKFLFSISEKPKDKSEGF